MNHLDENYFCKQKKWKSPQTVLNQMDYKKTLNKQVVGSKFSYALFLQTQIAQIRERRQKLVVEKVKMDNDKYTTYRMQFEYTTL